VREASVETYLRKQVEKAGGLCVKLAPAGNVGIPDRLVLLPGGVLLFVECKKPRGGRIARLQFWWCDTLAGLGFAHRFVLTKADVDEMMGTLNG
jgi:hypothetical protein